MKIRDKRDGSVWEVAREVGGGYIVKVYTFNEEGEAEVVISKEHAEILPEGKDFPKDEIYRMMGPVPGVHEVVKDDALSRDKDSKMLMLLADWFDKEQETRWGEGREVQNDLRRIAKAITEREEQTRKLLRSTDDQKKILDRIGEMCNGVDKE